MVVGEILVFFPHFTSALVDQLGEQRKSGLGFHIWIPQSLTTFAHTKKPQSRRVGGGVTGAGWKAVFIEMISNVTSWSLRRTPLLCGAFLCDTHSGIIMGKYPARVPECGLTRALSETGNGQKRVIHLESQHFKHWIIWAYWPNGPTNCKRHTSRHETTYSSLHKSPF